MNLNNISDKLVFKSLKFIKHGNIKLINYDNKSYNFGSPEDELKVKVKINKPGKEKAEQHNKKKKKNKIEIK